MTKAIETKYKGYRFRSRLEARWAVFFDACGYDWEYEPEGFELGQGVRYLPDFKICITDSNDDYSVFYFEVKPSGLDLTDLEKLKIEKFTDACWSENSPVKGYGDFIILDGVPEDLKLYKGMKMEDCCGSKWVIEPLYRGRPAFCEDVSDLNYGKIDWVGDSPATKAKSARFEYGECG